MTASTDPALADRLAVYAAGLRAAGAIRSDAVEAAFAAVLRHQFLPRFRYGADEYQAGMSSVPTGPVLDLIYANNALLTRDGQDGDPPSSSSAPSIMAKMLEAADLKPGVRVLEIGAGTGYNAALIHRITGATVITAEAGRRTALEAAAAIRAAGLSHQVHVVHGDGYDGHPTGGPYDRVIVTCGIAGIPPGWLAQLADEAMIIAPIAHAGAHPIIAIRHGPGRRLAGHALMWADFMHATGHLRPDGLYRDPAAYIPAAGARRIPGTGPVLSLDDYHNLWHYLGIRDHRITRAYPDPDVFDPAAGTCALTDPQAGTAWLHRDRSLTLAGAPELADHLTTLAAQWDTSGRPAVSQWLSSWHHADTGGAGLLLPARWTTEPNPAI